MSGIIREEAEVRVGGSQRLEQAIASGTILQREHKGQVLFFFPFRSLGSEAAGVQHTKVGAVQAHDGGGACEHASSHAEPWLGDQGWRRRGILGNLCNIKITHSHPTKMTQTIDVTIGTHASTSIPKTSQVIGTHSKKKKGGLEPVLGPGHCRGDGEVGQGLGRHAESH